MPLFGIMTLQMAFATVMASACLAGIISTHFEKGHTKTKQYLYPVHGVSSIKSMCMPWTGCKGEGNFPLIGLSFHTCSTKVFLFLF